MVGLLVDRSRVMTGGPPLSATYRIQLHRDFDFDAAARIVPYLKALGVSHLYVSPIFKARRGSTHGYDVINPIELNPELGGETGFLRLCRALSEEALGLIVDFVPNHMCVECADNRWWWEVLRDGPTGGKGHWFDIDWTAGGGRPRVVLPVLGRPYAECLEAGELVVQRYQSEWVVKYFDHVFPLSPDTIRANGGDLVRRYDPQDTAGRRRLHCLLERQHYRLAHWRLANGAINYRRFFDINSLAGVRIEEKEVFDAVHEAVDRLVVAGTISGLRIDHVDGLADPEKYCADLQTRAGPAGKLDVWVEKILGEGEDLPMWPGVEGTTGYECGNVISRLLVNPEGLSQLSSFWPQYSGVSENFPAILRDAKLQVLETLFRSEFAALKATLVRLAAGTYRTRDLSDQQIDIALREVLVGFDVYRTYLRSAVPSDEDRRTIERVAARAIDCAPRARDAILLIRNLLLGAPEYATYSRSRAERFVRKLQQLTGPLMAKGLEDTALYRDHRLLALNEVGNEPSLPPLSNSEFHRRMAERQAQWPNALTATATHDTKRGEDARTRILSITDLADEWIALVENWTDMNADFESFDRERRMPSRAHEYMLYQAILGGWPEHGAEDATFRERVSAYAIKAMREGKQETSWLSPDEQYEKAVERFIASLLQSGFPHQPSFSDFVRRCALLGALRSLVQVTLKALMPGVPDFYQGTERWDLSFVDPDNRRPVDFGDRAVGVQDASNHEIEELVTTWEDGRIKQELISRLLGIRRQFRTLLQEGDYQGLASDEGLLAFARGNTARKVIVLAAKDLRRPAKSGRKWPEEGDWRGIVQLPPSSRVVDLIRSRPIEVGKEVPADKLLGRLPVAVLELMS
jgi:(1->4)-alpha-D-glucan 1-alpha-D-glucosylmutase